MSENDIPQGWGIPNPDDLAVQKGFSIIEMEEEPVNHRFVAKRAGLVSIAGNFVQGANAIGIPGTAVANGTPILTVAIAANRRLILTKIKAVFIDTAGPLPCGLAIGTAAALPIAAPVDIVPLPQATAGEHNELADGQAPLLVLSGGVAGTNMIIYAPATFLSNAGNNAVTRTFQVSYAGILV